MVIKIIKQNKGFTLIELSIVLVIIGLIVAAVTAGQSLVKSARLKGVLTDVDQYRAAYNTFKLEYNALPGDITTATSYWTGTFDGNGNKQIMDHMSESVYAWQHLALAKLIAGTYTGVQQEIGDAIIGPIVPKSAYSSTSAYQFFYGPKSGWTGTSSTDNRNFLRFGRIYTPGAGDRVGQDALTSAEAKSLDTKGDDGIPGIGMIWARSIAGSCTTTTVTTTGLYDLTQSGAQCYMHFNFD